VTTSREHSHAVALQTTLRTASRFRSPTISALLALAILLGKALVCQHAPGRAVFFDAMLMVPIAMLAYHEGLVTGLVSGLVVTAVDLVMSAQAAGVLLPTYLSGSMVRTATVAKLFSLEVLAAIVSILSHRARRRARQAERQTEHYLKRIVLLQKHNEAMERDARDKQALFEKRLLRYSSLVYLIEESVQKIYSKLEVKHLFQSLFRVFEECFGSTCASVYLKDKQNGSYFLAATAGAEEDEAARIPVMLRPSDLPVRLLGNDRKVICWNDAEVEPALAEAKSEAPAIISGALVEKNKLVGIVHVHGADREGRPDDILMGVVCNIASIALANARLFSEVQWLAERDPLTRLPNRRTFHAELEAQLAARVADRTPLALLMLDIDHFKSFNDTYGHQVGDAVLEWFAEFCDNCSGEENMLFRYGGEEFTALMPDADVHRAEALAEKLRSRVEAAAFLHDGIELRVTLSCGVAVFPQNGADADALVRRADRAMYRAKAAGRNAVAVARNTSGHDSALVPYDDVRANAARSKTSRGTGRSGGRGAGHRGGRS
jgi:diguanylate cyclase (GGDEF)-like protein